jgi:hypothetical protein
VKKSAVNTALSPDNPRETYLPVRETASACLIVNRGSIQGKHIYACACCSCRLTFNAPSSLQNYHLNYPARIIY